MRIAIWDFEVMGLTRDFQIVISQTGWVDSIYGKALKVSKIKLDLVKLNHDL